MVFTSNFDQAALAAVLYVAHRLPHSTLHTLSKVLYFADRKHLERYGRFIFGDTYIAMKFGPVLNIFFSSTTLTWIAPTYTLSKRLNLPR